jgi:murein DD-endopeptidase MepM/ murein hydrolase activator NlpD
MRTTDDQWRLLFWTVVALALLLAATVLTNTVLRDLIQKKQERIAELEGYIEARRHVGGAERAQYRYPIHPADYVMPTSPFGERESPWGGQLAEHQGVDLLGVWRARIVAVADGVVVEHWVPPGGRWKGHPVYGGMVRIRHDDGNESLYAHLSESYVHEKDPQGRPFRVAAGQVIGRQGNTGRSQGDHLHFELVVAGEQVNPLLWVGEAE